MPESSNQDLAYESSPPGGGLTRRQGRWIILLLLLNTCFLGMYVLAPQFAQGVRQQWTDWQARRSAAKALAAQAALRAQQLQQALVKEQQWKSYEFPAGTVVYEEDPRLAQEYMISGKGYRAVPTSDIVPYAGPWQPPVIAPSPAPLAALSGFGFGVNEGLLFVHERRTPAGKPKLVFVTVIGVESGYQIGNWDRRVDDVITLSVHAFEPIDPATPDGRTTGIGKQWTSHQLKIHRPEQTNTILRMPNGARPPKIEPGPYLRLMTGSADANDPTHFEIPYRFGDAAGTVDGRLREDAIELRPRQGEIRPLSSWMLPAPFKR